MSSALDRQAIPVAQQQFIPNSKVEKKPREYEVFDSSCSAANPMRTHDINIDGKISQVTFNYGRPKLLSIAMALKFQKEGFIIKDEDGNVIARPSDTSIDTLEQFGTDKVIANLSELTREALYARAAILPGGEDFSINAQKNDLIGFLKEAAEKKITPKAVVASASTGIEEASDAELANMGLTEPAD